MLSKFKLTSKPTPKSPKGKSGIATRPKDNRRSGVEEDGDYLYALMQEAGIPDVEIDEFLRERKISLLSPTRKHKGAIRGFIRMHKPKTVQKQESIREDIQKGVPVELHVASASDISIIDELVAIPDSVTWCFMQMNGIMLALLSDTQKMRVQEFVRQWKIAEDSTKAAIIEYSMGYFYRNMKRATKRFITPELKKCFCNGTGKVFGALQVQCSCRTVMVHKL